MERKFILIVRITLVSLFLVILAGSVVRMSGSGMGCPDWPKCFGKWVPPTSVDQLPSDYKEKYAAKRKDKVERFAKLLSLFGMANTASELLNDDSIFIEGDFNASKTWTEYINRLIGAIAGLLVLIGTILSLRFYRHHPKWFWISLLNLILILITAWFGAVVVATNLTPWVLTTHMMLAILLVLSQINLLCKVVRPRFRIHVSRGFRLLLFLTILMSIAQLILGTQVRQQIDQIAIEQGESARGEWINGLGKVFLIHRSFSIALVLFALLLIYLNAKGRYSISLLNVVFLVLLFEAGAGILMNYAGMPKFAQPVHLMLGSIFIALLYYIYKRTQRN